MNQITASVDTLRCHIESADMKVPAELHLTEQAVTVRLGSSLSYEFAVVGTDVRVVVREVVNGKPFAMIRALHKMAE
jgi:hypothetical protein